ncbi:MAG: BatD family protein [Spirochaetota bacterium]|nr:BatD family protein [Spirochaetota bacterium]
MVKMRYAFVIIHALLILVPCILFADISIELKIEQYEANPSDSIRVVVSVSGTRDAETPKIHGLDNFIVRKGGTSTRMEIINGSFSSSIDYTYFIQPKRVGAFEIGPAITKVKGNTYRSNVKKLTVKKNLNQKGETNRPVFLVASVSSNKGYIEEQLIYTLKLYHLVNVSNVSLSLPDVENISFKQIGKPVEYNAKYNSKSYKVLEVKYSIIPVKAGSYVIDPAKMSMEMIQLRRRSKRPGSIFDDFFSSDPFSPFSESRVIETSSESVKLNIFPLPVKEKPVDFSGLVGSFRIKSTLEPSKIKAGESATLTVTLSGWGNVNRIPDLHNPEIDEAKIYADQPILTTKPGKQGIEGTKIMKWAVVPEEEGEYKIPPFSLSFFDTTSDTYRRITTSFHLLNVLPGQVIQGGKGESPDYTQAKRKEVIEELGRDIFPIHSSIKDLSSTFSYTNIEWHLFLLLIFPALIYVALIIGLKNSKRTPQRLAQSRAAKAADIIIKTCREKHVSANSISDALRDYMNHRFGLELGLLTYQDASRILLYMGCSGETAKQMEDILFNLETKIYTGQGDNACDLANEINSLIHRIEKESR